MWWPKITVNNCNSTQRVRKSLALFCGCELFDFAATFLYAWAQLNSTFRFFHYLRLDCTANVRKDVNLVPLYCLNQQPN